MERTALAPGFSNVILRERLKLIHKFFPCEYASLLVFFHGVYWQ
jgi:hypothetical protein